jgi:outer membrane protein, heavy metal efflux system
MLPKTLFRALACACLVIVGQSLCAPASSSSTSPALAALVREVLISHPGVRAAQAALAAARARARAASQPLYNPQLGLEVEEAAESSQALGFSQSIDWADKRGARAGIAVFERMTARAVLATARQELAGELLSALAGYHTARALARLGRHRTRLMRRFASVSEQRSQAGDLNRVDLEVARLAFAEAKLQRARAASDVVAARHSLIAIVGDARHEWPALSGTLPTAGARAPDFEALLNRLPVVRAERARMNAARSAIELQVRQQRPDPTIGLRGGHEENEALIGLNLSLPLFVRNTFSAEVDAANAELIRAQQQAQDTYRRAGARLKAAFERYRLASSARADWQASGQRSLTVQVNLLKRLWQAGALGATDFLVRLNQALDTRASAIDLRGHVWRAWFEWLVASGQTNAWLGADRM